MNDFVIGDLGVVDVAGRGVEPTTITQDQFLRIVFGVLEDNVLCSIATVTPEGTSHVNTAFFAYSTALELFFLSHPASRHCRNLASNPSVALTVFSSEQGWTQPGRGIQLFGIAEEASGSAAERAERAYGTRFPDYHTWKVSLSEDDLARQYRFYRIVVNTVKVLDEETLGAAIFAWATIVRPEGAPPAA
jgi:uncharacterized protein YhbP (UPF0306 family)